jgi:hypothetical protein
MSTHRPCVVLLHTVHCHHTLTPQNVVYVTSARPRPAHIEAALESFPHRSLRQTPSL